MVHLSINLLRILYLSSLNIMAPILNNDQWAVIGAKTKVMWEEQLLDPTNTYIITVIVSEPLVLLNYLD